MISLNGKTTLISGGSRGIGAAVAILFAKAGSNLVVLYQRDKKSADNVAREAQSYSISAIAVRCDVRSESSSRAAARATLKKFGRIDVLVNSAGIWERGEIGKTSLAAWKRTISANLDGTFNMCNAVIPVMRKQRSGIIVNISSTAGQRGEAMHSAYGASKGGVIAFTKSIAPEVIVDGIRVNCVAPGWVDTDMTARVMSNRAMRKKIEQTIPRGVVPTGDDIAGPVIFLASDLSKHVIGEILNVNGGSVLCG